MLNSLLTRPKSLQDLYRTYFSFANKFEFTSLLRNYIQNEEWKDTSTEKVWNMLAKISDDIGAVLTDDIVNYTRNVVDINTCKVPQMIEHARMLSYGLDHIKNSYDFFPNRIKCLVDIFSVNPEYLIGNNQNHVLSDQVIKEILIYIRDNVQDRTIFTNENVIDMLIDDPHGLIEGNAYRNFVTVLFFQSIVEELSSKYSETGMPIAFNMLFQEINNKEYVLSKIDEYKSWVDRYIWNEIEHPLNNIGQKVSNFANLVSNTKVEDLVLPNTIGHEIQMIKDQKKMSSKFNPFHDADAIYFNGLSPTNGLSQDELDLIEMVLNFHSKTMYNYQEQQFSDDLSTQYAYYRELEFCEYLKMVMFISNNLNSFNLSSLTYDTVSNKFIQKYNDKNSLRVVQIFNQGDSIVKNSSGNVVLNYSLILRVAKFLCDFVFGIQGIRENIKTIAQKHAMRGTGALVVHLVNDYLIKELPFIRDRLNESMGNDFDFKFGWELDSKYRHYVNVKLVEYEDDNEYFNIDPYNDVRFTDRTNARYWEKLDGMGDNDSLGVLTKGQIRDFYRNTLGIGRLQQRKQTEYDDIQDFLVDLFKIGANPISFQVEDSELKNPIDDVINKSEEDYGYTKQERLDVQNNTQLRENQVEQFLEYSGNDDIVANEIYNMVSNRIFYWKNKDYSSHVLHPFMYNLKIWNKLNNIIINGYKDYINSDLIDLMSTKVKFDQVFGEYGEGRNFWKYNITDLTGYTTRYEASIKDEHKDDEYRTTSELTGYDGLFYPTAAKEYLDLYNSSTDFTLPKQMFNSPYLSNDGMVEKDENHEYKWKDGEYSDFTKELYSIYWQLDEVDGEDTFYTRWYSHLNYTREEYQKIALQLWYWRDRIVELTTTNYPIKKYCLDVQGNSLILVSTFNESDLDNNPYLIDLSVQQNAVQDGITIDGYEYRLNRNDNEHVPFCDNRLVVPSEMWIRWKSNPIALPAFDVKIEKTNDDEFDIRYRGDVMQEFGQLTYLNSECNQYIRRIVDNWNSTYGTSIEQNKLPVFFDMEQSANVLALSSWNLTKLKKQSKYEEDGIIGVEKPSFMMNCAKNPFHLLSIERTSSLPSEYNLEEYSDNSMVNGNSTEWLFDAYHYCQANGSLLIPMYRFECEDFGSQKLHIRMFVVYAQQIKNDNYTVNNQIEILDVGENGNGIDLNGSVDVYSSSNTTYQKPRFDRQMMVCRNTNLVFSTYVDENGMDRVRCAFLGCFIDEKDDEYSGFKVNSCGAKTRYELDSKQTDELALLKDRHYRSNGDVYDEKTNTIINFFDDDVANSFNSYDSNDKYVMVVDIVQSIDNSSLFKNSDVSINTSSYNVLGDAGYIPHFAYQSLIKYNDDEGGISNTWRNEYLKSKGHLSFELLGLDDKKIPQEFEMMNGMVVEDLTDGCFTLLNPTKLTHDIYRIWCESIERKNKYGYFDSNNNWISGGHEYFPNEYAQFVNEFNQFNENDQIIWDVCENGEAFSIDVKNGFDSETLDEYFISVLRTSNGEIQNERKYILPPTSISSIIFPMDDDGNDGFVDCRIDDYSTSLIEHEHFVHSQVLFTGTQSPFNYGKDGRHINSKPENLQYGNGINGVGKVEVRVDVGTEFYKISDFRHSLDDDGNQLMDGDFHVIETPDGQKSVAVDSDGNVLDKDGNKIIKRRTINPILRITKVKTEGTSLLDRYQQGVDSIEPGSIMVILSHKNLDNVAKYHVLNRKSSLYFDGSLPKNGKNEFKYSDFKSTITNELVEFQGVDGKPCWKFKDGSHEFSIDDVHGNVYNDIFNESEQNGKFFPPYYVEFGSEKWYLEQDELNPDGQIEFKNQYSDEVKNVIVDVPGMGNFKFAHLKQDRPYSYIDYLYVKNGGLAFKVNEESNSFADAFGIVPGFYIDEKMRNKLNDLNDVQIQKEYSTFIHQSENPDNVKNCGFFNPLTINARLNYGSELIERYSESSNEDVSGCLLAEVKDEHGNYVKKIVQLSNESSRNRVELELEDGEIDDYLKIYTNYVRVDDGYGDFHYDLYFNIQNLFHSPFEYISSVTNQPNVLILKDSYLYLTGDKFKKEYDANTKTYHNEIDNDKMNSIKNGGILTIYGQVKTYSNDVLSDVNTIKLFQYQVYNVSDDKPKFLIKKIFDIAKESMDVKYQDTFTVKLSDVLWTIPEERFVGNKQALDDMLKNSVVCKSKFDTIICDGGIYEIVCEQNGSDDYIVANICQNHPIKGSNENNLGVLDRDTIVCDIGGVVCKQKNSVDQVVCDAPHIVCGDQDGPNVGENDTLTWSITNKLRVLDRDTIVIQPMKINYDYDKMDSHRINSISFDIVNDIIDFEHVPQLLDVYYHERTLRNGDDGNKPHYDHWSNNNMKLVVDPVTEIPRMTLIFDGENYNFETIYLKWKLPAGFNAMDTIDRLGGYAFSSTIDNISVDYNDSSNTPRFDIQKGYVTIRVPSVGEMHLGLEHSTTKRKNGYVLTGLKDAIKDALNNAIGNKDIKNKINEVK